MPYLIQKKPDGTLVKQWDLKDKPLSVGRGDQVHAKIDDPIMSRKHFAVLPKGNGYCVQDLGSHNGTWLNNVKVSEAVLKANDQIKAGQTHFVFVDALSTMIDKIEQESRGYATYVRELSEKHKP